MTHNQIIKELLVRMYITRPSLDAINSTKELSGPLSENFVEDFAPSNEWLNAALGGEAKALWDMVNESPYTLLETELLQRLDIVHYVHHKAQAGDFVENWLAMALHAPTETVKAFEAVLPYAESGLPWSEAWIWDQYKDQF